MEAAPRTAANDGELPADGEQYAHGGLRSTLAFLATAGCWDDTVDLGLASLCVIAKAMGAQYDALDKEEVKRNVCAAFRSEHAPSGEDLDALNLGRDYVHAAFKMDVTRLKRLGGEALRRAYIGLIMWAPPTRAIENGVQSGNWGAINEASIKGITDLSDADVRAKATEYLMDCHEARRPRERALVEDDGAPNAGNLQFAAALAKGIQDARASSASEQDKLRVDTEELARKIAEEPWKAGACAVMHRFGLDEDGKTIPTTELVAEKAKCQAIVDATHGVPPVYCGLSMSPVEFAAANETFYRNKDHEHLAKVAAAKITLINRLIDHSGAVRAAANAADGQGRVVLDACVARAAAEVASARAYAADVELFVICGDAATLRDDLVKNAVRDSSTLKRGQLSARRTVLHRALRKRISEWRKVWQRPRARLACCVLCVCPPFFLALYRIVLSNSERARSVSPSVGRARVVVCCVYCLIPVRAVVSRSSNVLALLGGLHQRHRFLRSRVVRLYTLSRRVRRVRRCVCVLSLNSSLPAALFRAPPLDARRAGPCRTRPFGL